jgi:hypothetical protein
VGATGIETVESRTESARPAPSPPGQAAPHTTGQVIGPLLTALHVEQIVTGVDRRAVAIADGDRGKWFRPHREHRLVEQAHPICDLPLEDPHPAESEPAKCGQLVVN